MEAGPAQMTLSDAERIELAKRTFAQAHDILQQAIVSGDQKTCNLAIVEAREKLRDAALKLSWAFDYKERVA